MADVITPEEMLLLNRQLERSKELLAVQEKLRDAAKESGEAVLIQLEYEATIAGEQKKQLEIKRQLGILTDEELEKYTKTLKDLDDALKKIDKQKKALERLGGGVKFIGEAWKDSFVGSLIDSGVTIDQIGSKLKETFSSANITGSFFLAIQQATIATVAQAGQLRGEVVGMQGDIEAFDDTVVGASTGAMAFGVGVAEASKASNALFQSMSSFSGASGALKNDLIQTAASFENLGISASTFGANMQIAEKSFGMTGKQALTAQKDMTKFAIGIGVSSGKLAEDFNANAQSFVAYGDAGIEMFKDLARQSKQTGIAMNDLLSITSQFDTFEGAADAAGKLNAVLGGGIVDSMQLLGATEAQRIDILRNSVAASGKSFDSMHRLERMTIANAAGITDMTKATALFSEKARQNAKDVNGSAISQEKLEEIQRKSVDTGKDLTLIFQSFAVAVGPLVSIIKFFTNGFLSLNDALGGTLAYLIGAGILISRWTSLIAIAAKTQKAWLAIKAFASILRKKEFLEKTALAIKNYDLAASQKAVDVASATSRFSLLAMGQALGAFGAAAAPAIPILLTLGAVFLMIGIGIGIAAAGLSLLAESASTLFGTLLDAGPAKMIEMASATYDFSLSMFGLGFAVKSVAPSLLLMTATLPLIGLMFAMMASSVTEVANGISSMAESLASVTSEGGIIEFTRQVGEITTDNVDNLSSLMDQAERYVEVQTSLKVGALVDPFVEALKQMTSIVAPAAKAAGSGSKEIVLVLDDREFGRAVTDVIDDKMNISMA